MQARAGNAPRWPTAGRRRSREQRPAGRRLSVDAASVPSAEPLRTGWKRRSHLPGGRGSSRCSVPSLSKPQAKGSVTPERSHARCGNEACDSCDSEPPIRGGAPGTSHGGSPGSSAREAGAAGQPRAKGRSRGPTRDTHTDWKPAHVRTAAPEPRHSYRGTSSKIPPDLAMDRQLRHRKHKQRKKICMYTGLYQN